MQEPFLIDSYYRRIRTLRLSITDRCNLRCHYCFTEEPIFMPNDSLLSYNEIVTILHICNDFRIHKIRITGGEPFVRPHVIPFFAQVKKELPHLDIRITTNGVFLEQYLHDLQAMGIHNINISLDTFNRETFKKITGKDAFDNVYRAICKSIEYGFTVKINAVAMKGFNDSELDNFIQFAMTNPVSVRFIEYMPIGSTTVLDDTVYWSTADILQAIQEKVTLTPHSIPIASGPAKVYNIAGGLGTIGVISPLSNHFCDDCDRLRITADGLIKTCLYSTENISLRDALRSENPIDNIRRILIDAVMQKPLGVELLETRNGATLAGRSMNAIGG